MSTSYSTNLALALPATGELSGTWGTTVNTNITNMLDEALGYQAYSATGGADTITIPDGTTGVARSIYIQLNGTGGGSVAVPATKTKMYFVFNNTSSAITFKVTGQTGVSIPAAAKMALVSNGTDVIVAQNYFAALTLGAALPVASGGTGLTAGTSGGVLAYTATGTLASSAALAASALVIGGGAGAAPSTTTTGTGVVTALGVNTGTAGAFVVNGGALGTPSSGTVTNLTGTASININGTVGATTANTGAFTTLSADKGSIGTVATFKGGTKTAFIYSDNSYLALTDAASAGGTGTLINSSTPTVYQQISGSLVTAVTSTGLAVTGTLSATGNATVGNAVAATDVYLNIAGVASRAGGIAFKESGVDKWLIGNGAASNNGKFELYNTTGVVVLSVDKTSSVSTFGAGVAVTGTLSATSSVHARGFDVPASGVGAELGYSSPNVFLRGYDRTNSVYKNLTLNENISIVGGSAGQVSMGPLAVTGALSASGEITAGYNGGNNGITFTQDWRIRRENATTGNLWIEYSGSAIATFTSAGNLGLGVTPSAWVDYKAIQLGGGAIASYTGNAFFECMQNTFWDGASKYVNNGFASSYQQTSGQHRWNTAASGTAGNAISFTQAMTLDADGDLGIGTTSPAAKLHIGGNNGIRFGDGASAKADITYTSAGSEFLDIKIQGTTGGFGNIRFSTGGTPSEAARIDSSGSLLVGTMSSSFGGRVIVSNDGTATQTSLSCINTLGSGTMRQIDFFTGTNTSRIGSIESTTTLTSYNVTSDYRLKKDIAPMTGALAKIAQLKPVTYKWKVNGSDGQGFIAHELAEVVPDCVSGEKDAVNAKGDPEYQGIDVSFLVATLTAAIQEQQALITQLTARITALETA